MKNKSGWQHPAACKPEHQAVWLRTLPWHHLRGWLGVKSQFIYLSVLVTWRSDGKGTDLGKFYFLDFWTACPVAAFNLICKIMFSEKDHFTCIMKTTFFCFCLFWYSSLWDVLMQMKFANDESTLDKWMWTLTHIVSLRICTSSKTICKMCMAL